MGDAFAVAHERVGDVADLADAGAPGLDPAPIYLCRLTSADETENRQLGGEIAADKERIGKDFIKCSSDGFKLRSPQLKKREPLTEQAALRERTAHVLKMFQREQPPFASPPRQEQAAHDDIVNPRLARDNLTGVFLKEVDPRVTEHDAVISGEKLVGIFQHEGRQLDGIDAFDLRVERASLFQILTSQFGKNCPPESARRRLQAASSAMGVSANVMGVWHQTLRPEMFGRPREGAGVCL